MDIDLTTGQTRAVEMINSTQAGGVYVVAGPAGCGKTTLLTAAAGREESPIILAPTGKAALRVREATGLSARTIHRWLYSPVEDEWGDVTFTRREELEIPESRRLFLDEASMLQQEVWEDLSEVAEQHDLAIILIGDSFQLPPVTKEKGEPFSVFSPSFPCSDRVNLDQILRQAADSPILKAANAIRSGSDPWKALAALPRLSGPALMQKVVRVAASPDGAVICFKNETRNRVNGIVRKALGRSGPLETGEPLMVIKNNYRLKGEGGDGLFNGERVIFLSWRYVSGRSFMLARRGRSEDPPTVRFAVGTVGDGQSRPEETCLLCLEEVGGTVFNFSDLKIASRRWLQANENVLKSVPGVKMVEPKRKRMDDGKVPSFSLLHANYGYVATCHKFQGSQADEVVVLAEPGIRSHTEEGRRWLYTAITRAKKLCWIGVP